MQIDGMREFAARTRELSFGVAARDATSAGPLAGRKRSATDAFDISDLGRRLCLERATASLVEEQKAEEAQPLPPVAARVDQFMAKAQGLLEQMRTIALTAQDESLSDLDRIELQIELEDLKDQLGGITRALRGDDPIDEPLRISDALHQGDTIGLFGGDDTSVLSRARERILKGEAWDVREAWSASFYDITEGSWQVVDDGTVWTQDAERDIVATERQVPTVREIIETWSTSIMDAESATKAVEKFDRRIAAIEEWREDLPVNLPMYADVVEEACAFLDKEILLGSFILSKPSAPSFYFDGGRVHDSSYMKLMGKIDTSVPSPLAGLSLSEEQMKPGLAWGREGEPIWRIDPDVG
ncbi:MAG: hypothetical protein IJR14_04495, partial [Synergistaceae bacterium]|nr:hypothetical protein [Synergistaceae bacterium]